jgi:hypothetical protein
MEHEMKEVKADVLCATKECAGMKTIVAEFQVKMNKVLEAVVANHHELIAGLGVWDDNVKRAFNSRDN